jgi:hypothetical protein
LGELNSFTFADGQVTGPLVKVASGANTDPALVYDEGLSAVSCMFATGPDWRLAVSSTHDGGGNWSSPNPVGNIITTAAVASISDTQFGLAVLFADCSSKAKEPLNTPAKVVVATSTGGWNDWVALPSRTQRGVSLAGSFATRKPNDFYWRAFALYRSSSNTDLYYTYTTAGSRG